MPEKGERQIGLISFRSSRTASKIASASRRTSMRVLKCNQMNVRTYKHSHTPTVVERS